jgi:glutathione S-transferase
MSPRSFIQAAHERARMFPDRLVDIISARLRDERAVRHPAAQTFGCLWRPQRFSDDKGALDGIRAKGRGTIETCFAAIEERLDGSHAVGGAFTAVDPFLLVFFRWGNAIGIDMSREYPRYAAFAEPLVDRASVKAAIAAERISPYGHN